MHESKYEPMEKTDAEKIMEEILSMQAGLNPASCDIALVLLQTLVMACKPAESPFSVVLSFCVLKALWENICGELALDLDGVTPQVL